MIIANSLIISLIVLFVHSTTWEGMVFEQVKRIIPPEDMLYKPLYGCPICMTPWWGSAIYWIFYHHSWQDWLLTLGAAAGFSVLWVCALSLRDACIAIEDKFTEDGK